MSSGRKRRHSTAGNETSETDETTSDTPARRASRATRTSALTENGDLSHTAKRARTLAKTAEEEDDEWSHSTLSVQDICKQLFSTVRDNTDKSGRHLADEFLALPSRKLYPDYDEIIKTPIALNTIQAKVQTNKYRTVTSLRKDIELLFNNAQEYNRPDSQVYLDAVFLLDLFHKKYNDLKKSTKASAPGSTIISIRINGAGAGEHNTVKDFKPVDTPAAPDPVVQTNAPVVVKRGPGRPRKSAGGKSEKGPATLSQATPVKMEDGSRHDELFDAIERGDAASVRKLLKKVNINMLQPVNLFGQSFTWSPLHAASYFGHDVIVDLLVEKGADVELEDTWYRGRALAWGAYGGHITTCRMLVKKYHADRKAKNDSGQTAYELLSEPDSEEWRSILLDEPPKSAKKEDSAKRGRAESETNADDMPAAQRVRRSSGQQTPNSTGKGQPLSKMKLKLTAQPDADTSNGNASPPTGLKMKIKIPPQAQTTVGRRRNSRRGSALEEDIDVEALSETEGGPQGTTMSGIVPMASNGMGSSAGHMQAVSAQSATNANAVAPRPFGPANGQSQNPYSSQPAVGPSQPVVPQQIPKFIISIGLVSNDDIVRRVLPMEGDLGGHAMCVEHRARSLNLRLLLKSFEAGGVHYTVTGRQTSPQMLATGMMGRVPQALSFTPAGAHVFDCLAYLEEGVNSFDFDVVAMVGGGPAISQSVSLFLMRD